MKRKNGRKYYPPLEFVPADVGPDGKVVVPSSSPSDDTTGKAKGNGVVKTESFKETDEERRKREAEEEKEELERKVRMCACVYRVVPVVPVVPAGGTSCTLSVCSCSFRCCCCTF